MFQSLYATPIKGSLLGTLYIDDQGDNDSADNLDPNDNVFRTPDSLTWIRPPNTTAAARTYELGFGMPPALPVALTAVGGRYFPPVKDVTRLLNVTGLTNNAEVSFGAGGLDLNPSDANNPNQVFNVGAKDVVTVPVFKATPPPNPNPTKTAFSVVPGTGAFKGTFTLINDDPRDPLPNSTKPRPAITRAVTYQGLIINNNGILQGVGYFLLPQLPTDNPATLPTTSNILSGWVDLHTYFVDPLVP